MTISAVKELALQHSLSIFQPTTFNADELATLAALKPDIIIVAAYGIILPKALLDIPELGCINVHASL